MLMGNIGSDVDVAVRRWHCGSNNLIVNEKTDAPIRAIRGRVHQSEDVDENLARPVHPGRHKIRAVWQQRLNGID